MRVRHSGSRSAEGTACRVDRRARLLFPCFIPEDVQHQMMEGDFSRAKMIFEQASRVDFSQYPIEEHKPKTISPGSQTQEPPLYGSGAFGFMIDI